MKILFLLFLLAASSPVFAGQVPSFGLMYLDSKCATDTQKSFLSTHFPVLLKSAPPTVVSALDKIEVKSRLIDDQKSEVVITGFIKNDIYLNVQFVTSNQLVVELKSYVLLPSKGNRVFIITEADHCLDRHSYKVEKFSILNPWR